jgi:hypothetical protein
MNRVIFDGTGNLFSLQPSRNLIIEEKRPLGDRQVGHQAARLRRPLPASMRDHSPAKKRESGCTVHAGRHVVLRIGNHKADAEGIAGSVEHLIDD